MQLQLKTLKSLNKQKKTQAEVSHTNIAELMLVIEIEQASKTTRDSP